LVVWVRDSGLGVEGWGVDVMWKVETGNKEVKGIRVGDMWSADTRARPHAICSLAVCMRVDVWLEDVRA
jgi:hypothetical protein